METIRVTDIILLVLIFSLGAMVSKLSQDLRSANRKLEVLLEQFDGLREYLYEIDPQFDDERETGAAFDNEEHLFAGMDDLQLKEKKKREGRRTLNSPFLIR